VSGGAIVRQCDAVRQCAAVCGCASGHAHVWQCGGVEQCDSVRQCVTVCSSVRGIVRWRGALRIRIRTKLLTINVLYCLCRVL
jgi:hypothetical protein